MRSFFPLSAKALDVKSLLIIIGLYILVSLATGFVLGIFSWLPLLGYVLRLISKLIDFYCLAGIVVAIMIYFNL